MNYLHANYIIAISCKKYLLHKFLCDSINYSLRFSYLKNFGQDRSRASPNYFQQKLIDINLYPDAHKVLCNFAH